MAAKDEVIVRDANVHCYTQLVTPFKHSHMCNNAPRINLQLRTI